MKPNGAIELQGHGLDVLYTRGFGNPCLAISGWAIALLLISTYKFRTQLS